MLKPVQTKDERVCDTHDAQQKVADAAPEGSVTVPSEKLPPESSVSVSAAEKAEHAGAGGGDGGGSGGGDGDGMQTASQPRLLPPQPEVVTPAELYRMFRLP